MVSGPFSRMKVGNCCPCLITRTSGRCRLLHCLSGSTNEDVESKRKKGVDSLVEGSNIWEAEFTHILILSSEDHTRACVWSSLHGYCSLIFVLPGSELPGVTLHSPAWAYADKNRNSKFLGHFSLGASRLFWILNYSHKQTWQVCDSCRSCTLGLGWLLWSFSSEGSPAASSMRTMELMLQSLSALGHLEMKISS